MPVTLCSLFDKVLGCSLYLPHGWLKSRLGVPSVGNFGKSKIDSETETKKQNISIYS